MYAGGQTGGRVSRASHLRFRVELEPFRPLNMEIVCANTSVIVSSSLSSTLLKLAAGAPIPWNRDNSFLFFLPTTLNTEVEFWVCHYLNHYHHQYSERVWCVEKKRADCIIIRRIEDLEVAELWAFHLTLWMWWMSIWHRDAVRCEVSDHLSSLICLAAGNRIKSHAMQTSQRYKYKQKDTQIHLQNTIAVPLPVADRRIQRWMSMINTSKDWMQRR